MGRFDYVHRLQLFIPEGLQLIYCVNNDHYNAKKGEVYLKKLWPFNFSEQCIISEINFKHKKKGRVILFSKSLS